MKESWKTVGRGGALIVLLTAVAYFPAMHGGFVFDDHLLITDNRILRASDGLYRYWFTTDSPDYYPLTGSLWWLEWRLWGNSAVGYHIVNVLLHAFSAALVWMILRHLKIPGAWLTALVFAVHPVNVATVAWISEQKNTLSMLFYATTILLYLRFEKEGRWRWYGFSLASFLFALLSKTAVVMLPFVLLGCVWWRRGRITRKDLLCSGPFFVLSLVLGLVTIWFQYHRALGGHPVRTDGFFARLAAAGWASWFYLYKALLPFNLSVIYRQWNVNASLWVSYLPGIVLVGCLALFWWKRKSWGRAGLFALGYFVVTLFPVLGFFDQGYYRYSLVADHWQYYSIIGVIALAVAAGVAICRRMRKQGRSVGVAASVVVLMVLGVATWTRASVYRAAESLWRDTVTKNPDAWVAQNNLGNALLLEDRIEEAIGHYEQALRINPDMADTHNNLGFALLQAGKAEDAIRHLEQALLLKPDYAEAHYNLGNALLRVGKVSEAMGQYEQALRLKPDYAEAQNNLGFALQKLGKVPEAIGHWEQALRLKPDYAEAHYNIGVALEHAGRAQEAMAEYVAALRINPGLVDAHFSLGDSLARRGEIPEAAAEYQAALRIRPEDAEAHFKIGVLLAALGEDREAIAHYREVLRLRPDLPSALRRLAWLLATDEDASVRNTGEAIQLAERLCEITGQQQADALMVLAAAYAEAGRFAEAIRVAQKALELARNNGQEELAVQVQEQLKLYREGRPYHESWAAPPPR